MDLDPDGDPVSSQARDGRPVILDLTVCASCSVCGEVIEAATPHVTYVRIVESHHEPKVVRLHDGDVIKAFHLGCEEGS